MNGSKPPLLSRIVTVATLLGIAALIVWGTVYVILLAAEDNPRSQPVMTEATNYTPFVGKKW